MLPISIKNNGKKAKPKWVQLLPASYPPQPQTGRLAMAMTLVNGQCAMGSNTIKAITDQKRNKTHTKTETREKRKTKTEPNNKTYQTICTKVYGSLYTARKVGGRILST